ncbi:MAG TPA: AMP-binding protein [Candidatus Eremiobacteraceae bacterium]|nr:AMP-binding protein [Candidatus Eremiobacteraceae bacterium]
MIARTPNMTDYESTRRSFAFEVPEYYNFASYTIDGWARDRGKLAMIWTGEGADPLSLTFAHFSEASSRLADALRSLGVQPGDRALLVASRIPEWWEALLGMIRAGVIPVPGTTLLTPKDFVYRANTAGAVAAFVDEANLAKLREVRDQCPTLKHIIVFGRASSGAHAYDSLLAGRPTRYDGPRTKASDPCLIYFTSGTTGNQKMVLHTQASYPLGHIVTGKFWLDLQPNDLHWNLSDTGWAKAAWSSVFGPWQCGSAIFVNNATGKFSAAQTLRMLEEYPITTLCGPPTAYRMLVLEPLERFKPKALRHCVAAGEPLNPEVIDMWKRHTGMTIRDGYGQTETVLLCGNFPPLDVKPGSMGKPSPGFDVAVIGDDLAPVPAGKEGDIAVRVVPTRPVGLFKEYWKNPAEMAKSFRGDWYITGDRAFVDEDGYFWFVGRGDDVINSSGYRIGPFEVESALIEHPAVAESAVVASPDEMRGEIVKAFVILAPGYTASDALAVELQEHCKNLTAPYKYPREIEFVTELPKTISGKIRRVELREREKAKKSSRW